MGKSIEEIRDREKRKKAEQKMISDHKKITKKEKKIAFAVKDPCNTVFLCKDKKRGEEVVEKYKKSHEIFWK